MKTAKPNPFVRHESVGEFSRSTYYAVHGFWSGDNVRVSQSRSYETKKWEAPKINWSCGGRVPKVEPDDLVAAECFGLAIADAVVVARGWWNEL